MHLKKIAAAALIIASFIFASEKTFAQANAPAATDSLVMYRNQIDELDKQIIQLLGQRMQVVEKVGIYKSQHNIAVLQQKRFDAILQKNIDLGKQANLSETFITALMNAIHNESLQKENAIQTSQQQH